MARLGYRPALDGVRALAIAPVVGVHVFGLPHEGNLGVDLFFVLSGFLITTLLLEERAATGRISFGAFYRRRAARLMPGLLLMLAIYTIATRGADPWAVLFGATYTTNIAHLLDPGSGPFALGHLWSLAQEEQFYLLWPPLLLFLVRRWPALLTRVIGLMILAVLFEKVILLSTGSSLLRIYGGPDTHADPILVGCLFGALFATGRAPKVGRFGGPLALTAVVAAVVTAEWVPTLRATHATSILRIAFFLACAFLILGAMEGRIVARALSIRPLTFLGRISYSLYLWHVPIVAAASTTAMDGGVRSVVAACSAVAVASASFYLFEQPLSKRWRHSRAPALLTPAVQAEAA